MYCDVVLIHVADVILERFYVAEIAGFFLVELSDLLLHAVALRDQILHDQVHVVIGALKVDDLTVHVGNLFPHLGNFLFSGADISLQLLYLIVQHKFELLKFLSFFLELVDTSHLVSDSFLPLFDLLGLRLLSLKILFVLLFDLLYVFKSMLQSMLLLFKRPFLLFKYLFLG